MSTTRAAAAAAAAKKRVLGVLAETKSAWERRCPVAPKHVEALTRDHGVRVLVQPSHTRIFADEDFRKAGAEITSDMSQADVLVGVKEVKMRDLLPNKTYVYFSHTIKAQPHNMKMLDDILAKNIRLLDYECLKENGARSVKFGHYAGVSGMIGALSILGDRLVSLGNVTPLVRISQPQRYPTLANAYEVLDKVGQEFKLKPSYPKPVTIVVTGGKGAVSMGAIEVLRKLPNVEFVAPKDFAGVAEAGDPSRIYVTHLDAADHLRLRDGSGKFDFQDYLARPERYESFFADAFLPHADLMVNAIYWEARYPRLVTFDDLTRLRAKNQLRLKAVQDITCDIDGSVQLTTRACTIQEPYFVTDIDTRAESTKIDAPGVVVMSIDYLPAQLPYDASVAFGDMFMPYVVQLTAGDDHSPALVKASITENGALTPDFAYIAKLRASTRRKRVVVVGSGMVAGPCVGFLKDHGYEVCVVDADGKRAAAVGQLYGVESGEVSASDEAALSRAIKGADAVVSLVPATMHDKVVAACMAHRADVVTASYTSDKLWSMNESAKSSGITVLTECGLDPGLDHIEAMRIIEEARSKGSKVLEFESWCGGLPAAQFADNPLGYKFSWSPIGALSAARNPARFLENGAVVEYPSGATLRNTRPINAWRGLALEGYANRDSVSYRDLYGLTDARTVLRGTLRFKGFCELVSNMHDAGVLSDSLPDASCRTWNDALKGSISQADAQALGLVGELNRSVPMIQQLAAVLQNSLVYGAGEADLVAMYHRFVVADTNGSRREIMSSFVETGAQALVSGKPLYVSAMARTVGTPAALAAHLILSGKLKFPGVTPAYQPAAANVLAPYLPSINVHFRHSERTL